MYRSNRPSAFTGKPGSYKPARPLQAGLAGKSIHSKRRIITTTLLAITVIMLVGGAILFGRHDSQPATKQTATTTTSHTATKGAATNNNGDATSFNRTQHSTTDPASIWIVVNKQRPLNPKTYVPANLVVPHIPLRSNITSNEKYVRADMAAALEKMVNDAATAGVHFNLQSGYRSYAFQASLYNGYVQSQGQSVADRQSARAGYSEHQTGLAADLGGITRPACNVESCYATTPEGIWLAAHAYEYGFIVRYPSDKEPVTGYLYEPWHIRYIGTELSNKMNAGNIETLEEFFSLGAAPGY